jgi:PTS system nitrogen regulatory IIA component
MLKVSGKTGVLQVLSRLAAGEADLNEESVLHSIPQMERPTPFGVGRRGVVPHEVMSGVSGAVGVFAHLKHPVDFDTARQPMECS